MGRTAKPAALKLISGRAPGRDSGGRVVNKGPAFRRIPPKAPTWLSREAAAEWKRVAPGLERLDLLKEEDRAVLAAYCETWSQFVTATRTVSREGITSEVTTISVSGAETTRTVPNPAVAIARSAGRELRAFAAQFGLTPSSEQALARGADNGEEDDNPF